MSKKMTHYSTELKTKVVLEALQGDKTINEIASSYNIIPKNILNWKKSFLENAQIAMEPSRAVKEYKDEIESLKAKNDEYAKALGKVTIERDWLAGKLESLDSLNKKELIESEHQQISITRQCALLGVSRSTLYYATTPNTQEQTIKEQIQRMHSKIPSYGYLKVHQQLLEEGYSICANTVQKYRKALGLKAILAVRAPYTSAKSREHPVYGYKLKGLKITRANQVWSTDITYIRIKGGFVYLAAIIDWYSKAVLSWRISSTMDSDLVMSVLNEALRLYGTPELFNTDQGSQYTSYIHTQRLKEHGIEISMNGSGRSTDNICIERFWRSAKVEKIYLQEYKSIAQLKEDVKAYIDFYNHERFHESLKYQKPMKVYYESLKASRPHDHMEVESVEYVA